MLDLHVMFTKETCIPVHESHQDWGWHTEALHGQAQGETTQDRYLRRGPS